MMRNWILAFIFCCLANCHTQAQNWDINTLKTINSWHIYDLSRGLSDSGILLPIGVPTAMGVYALIKKDQPLLKDAIYIGTSVIEARLPELSAPNREYG